MVTSAEAVEPNPKNRTAPKPKITSEVKVLVSMGGSPLDRDGCEDVGSWYQTPSGWSTWPSPATDQSMFGVVSPRLPQPGGSLLSTSSAFFIPCSALMSEVLGFLVGPLMDMDTAEIFRTAFFWLQ